MVMCDVICAKTEKGLALLEAWKYEKNVAQVLHYFLERVLYLYRLVVYRVVEKCQTSG